MVILIKESSYKCGSANPSKFVNTGHLVGSPLGCHPHFNLPNILCIKSYSHILLLCQEADLALSGITATYGRSQAVDFTFPHWIEPSVMALKLYPNKWRYFLDPLSPQLFLAYLCTPVVLGLVVWFMELLDKVGCRGRRVLEETHCGPRGVRQKLVSLWNLMFVFMQNVLEQGIPCGNCV